MCIIAVTPPKTVLTQQEIDNCWRANDDGAGFAYFDSAEKVQIRKGFMKKPEFVNALKSAQTKHGKTSPFLIHFRIRTHGLQDAERTHPFRLPDGSSLVHNGVLHGSSFCDNIRSDTQIFVDKFGELLTKAILEKEKEVIADAIGYNKLAILHTDGSFTIVNEKLGTWDAGRWFSNRAFRPITSLYKH